AAKRIGFISEKPIYYYVNRDNSLSKIRISDPWGDVVDTIKEYLIDGGLYEEYANTLNALNVAATVVSIDRIYQMYTGNRMRSEAKLRLNKFKNVHDNNKTIDKQNLTFKAKIFIPFLKLNMYIPIVVCSRVRRLRNKFV
ncbi:MAG: hypothetical protein SOY12_10460, partial [Schaedlerella sp.]|nr:hypothetical protein [Schaedlerella sp.]